MYQQITIIGNVGKEPEMKYTQQGQGVCSFSVAVNKTWNDRQTNEKRQKTTWFRVSAWRALAEVCSQYVHKGMLIMVIGEIDVNAYASTEGPRASLELTAYEVKFLQRGEVTTQQNETPQESYSNSQDSDIPF